MARDSISAARFTRRQKERVDGPFPVVRAGRIAGFARGRAGFHLQRLLLHYRDLTADRLPDGPGRRTPDDV